MTDVPHNDRLRSWDLVSLLSVRTLGRLLAGMLRAPFDRRFAGSPLAVCWFVTFACNARCSFCCKAAEIRRGREAFGPLAPADAAALMARIRRTVDILYLSGGEPLVHPHIEAIVREARRLRFASVGMSSNLIALGEHADVLEHLDAISVSIHAPDPAGHARSLGVAESVAREVFANLDRLASWRRRRGRRVIVNCVVHPGNVDRAAEMVDFTARRGFLLEVVPANDHPGLRDGLADDPAYAALIDRLIRLRRMRRAPHLAGSTAYYRRLKSLRPFRCFPYGVPNIMPDGRLCTPCDVSGRCDVSVLDHDSLREALRASLPRLGAYPCREGRCFKAALIERSRLFGLLVPESSAATKVPGM